MSFPPTQLREIATAAGVTDRAASTLLAGTMQEESKGDPEALGDYDEQGNPTSFGILQVHEPTWPAIVAATKSIMAASFTTRYGRAVAEVKVARPILEDAMHQAFRAAKILQERDFRPELQDVLLLADAAWQGPGIESWARTTESGDPAEIREATAPGRGERMRSHLAVLGVGTKPGKLGWVLPVGILLAGGIVTWALVEGLGE